MTHILRYIILALECRRQTSQQDVKISKYNESVFKVKMRFTGGSADLCYLGTFTPKTNVK